MSLAQTPLEQRDQYGQPLDAVARRGLEIYEGRLKPLLEPEHSGEVVAIHVETGDHAVAASSPEAMRAMRWVHPSGLLFLYTIEPAHDHSLARRMMGLQSGTEHK